MSDMGDDFNALKKMRQEKRASNRDDSAEMLRQAGVTFESKNIGAHLIVQAGKKMVDFWPGTGLWLVRGDKVRRRGVRELVKHVAQEKAKP